MTYISATSVRYDTGIYLTLPRHVHTCISICMHVPVYPDVEIVENYVYAVCTAAGSTVHECRDKRCGKDETRELPTIVFSLLLLFLSSVLEVLPESRERRATSRYSGPARCSATVATLSAPRRPLATRGAAAAAPAAPSRLARGDAYTCVVYLYICI